MTDAPATGRETAGNTRVYAGDAADAWHEGWIAGIAAGRAAERLLEVQMSAPTTTPDTHRRDRDTRKRQALIGVRLSPEELATLKAVAARDGVSLPGALRQGFLQSAPLSGRSRVRRSGYRKPDQLEEEAMSELPEATREGLAEWDSAGFETMLRDSLGDHVVVSCADLGHFDDVIERASDAVTRIVATATAAERESCARLAEEHHARVFDERGDDWTPFADLIRARTTP